jgi:outer membrane protein assembly factor BamB
MIYQGGDISAPDASGLRVPSAAVRRRRRLLRTIVIAVAVAVTSLVIGIARGNSPAATAAHPPRPGQTSGRPHALPPVDRSASGSRDAAVLSTAPRNGHLAPGSDPSVLPGPILIADKANNRLLIVDPQGRVRWQFPRRGDLKKGQTFRIPDDAFFTPDGKEIVATQEDDSVISVIDIASHRIVYRYGHPGHPGAAPGYVHNPDDAMMLPDGYLISADIKNCRVLLIPPGGKAPARTYGTIGSCVHAPPTHFGSPNGAFPMRDGSYLVTEINGDWVDELRLDGAVRWSVHPPGVAYPSDTNEVANNRYLTVDYSQPGQVLEFNRFGKTLWRYRHTSGRAALDHPSLAIPLPNGDVLLNDDYDDRVIVIDPHTQRIVWQYGHDHMPGRSAGFLHIPDGVDLLPPYSLLGTHAATMGQP